jgi:hypothetical protein
MKNRLLYIVVTAILSGIAMLAVYGQNASERNQISFSIRPFHQRVLPLETIRLEFTFANQTNEKLKLRSLTSLNSIKLEIRKPSGETVVPKQLSYMNDRRFASEKILEPGQTHLWRDSLELKLGDYFGEVGEYALRANYQSYGQLLTTDWVTLTVEQPVGEDLAAYEKLKTLPGMRDGTIVMGVNSKAARAAFIEQFPNSRYADYYRYKTAEGLFSTDRDKAIEYFEAVASKPDFVFVEDAKQKLDQLRVEKEHANRLEEHRKAKAKPAGN